MYTITIQHNQPNVPALKLITEKRSLARSAYLLGEENKLKVDVVVEVKARQVRFKGVTPPVQPVSKPTPPITGVRK